MGRVHGRVSAGWTQVQVRVCARIQGVSADADAELRVDELEKSAKTSAPGLVGGPAYFVKLVIIEDHVQNKWLDKVLCICMCVRTGGCCILFRFPRARYPREASYTFPQKALNTFHREAQNV